MMSDDSGGSQGFRQQQGCSPSTVEYLSQLVTDRRSKRTFFWHFFVKYPCISTLATLQVQFPKSFNVKMSSPFPSARLHHSYESAPWKSSICSRLRRKAKQETHCLGHFHPRFVIVNGPNGCGKSNVIDGLLFVFGYRSKRLRVERVSELIFNHPDQRKQPTECRVEVFMKVIRQTGLNEFDDVMGEAVRVMRVGRRNGSSDYFLDGVRAPQKDVVERLKTYGIDMDHHRFLILQGEVEQIALMPPKAKNEHDEGLLEYLEDIIGTSRLHEPMGKLQTLLDDLKIAYEIKAKDQLLKRNEVQKLEANRREAEFVLLEYNAINAKRYLFKLIERRRVAISMDAAQHLINTKKIEEDAVTAELAQFDAVKHDLQSKHKDAQRAVADIVEQHEQLTSQITTAENEITQLKVDVEHAKTASTRLEKECVLLQKDIDNIGTLPERLNNEISTLTEQRPALEELVVETKRQYDVLVRNANTAADKFRRELQDCAEKQKPIKAQRTAKTHARESKQQEHNSTNRAYNDAKAALDSLLTEKADGVAAKRIEVDQARQMQLQPAQRGNDSRELKALMMAKQDGTLPGIVGRLGDLAGIDEQYVVAICSLMQNVLNSVVVKTSADARACIAFLRERTSGYSVTFIDLERKWEQNRQKLMEAYNDIPENAPRLFDLVQIDADQPKIRATFFSYLYHTRLATDTAQAMRIGLDKTRRRRVVTLGGDVIEPSGSMAGGGKPLRGLIGREARVQVSRNSGQVVTPADLAAFERQLNELVELFNAETDKLRLIEEQGRRPKSPRTVKKTSQRDKFNTVRSFDAWKSKKRARNGNF